MSLFAAPILPHHTQLRRDGGLELRKETRVMAIRRKRSCQLRYVEIKQHAPMSREIPSKGERQAAPILLGNLTCELYIYSRSDNPVRVRHVLRHVTVTCRDTFGVPKVRHACRRDAA